MAFKESRLLAEQPGSLGHYTLHALHDVAPAFPSPLGVAYSNLVEIFARPAHTQPSSQSLHSFSTRHNRRSNRHTTHGMTPTTPAACVRGKGSYGELLQASATAASDRQSSFDDSLTTIPYTPNRTVRRRRTKTEPIGNDITSSVLKLIAQKADAPCYAPTTNAQQEISSIANIYGEATSPTLDVNLERLGVDNPFESIQSWRLISNTPISALSPTKKSRQTHPPGLLSLFAPSPSLHSFTSSTIHDETFSDSPDTQSNPCSHASEPSSAIPSDEGDCTIIHHTAPRASSPANPTPPTQTHAHRHRRIISSRLLDLKASATKVVDPRNATHRSGRKISLRIPIKPSLSHAPSPTKPDCATVPVQAQRELEYQHRHTFIGTGSLDDFLEALDVSADARTDKRRVAKAFIELAAREQVIFRQHGVRSEGWENVIGITGDTQRCWEDCVVQARVKLGCVSLLEILGMVGFDIEGGVGVMGVVGAFCEAARRDMKGGRDGGRARAVRGWMIGCAEGRRGEV